jgi:hypothetical protein
MIGEIRRNHLDVALAKRDWTAFARGYNGKGYAANRYDERLRLAFAKWAVAFPPADDVEQIGDRGEIIAAYQKRLRELGYTPGTVDGDFGSRTRAAVLAFQAENGLSPDGRIDKLTRAGLNAADAKAMPVGARVLATADDLAKAGSATMPWPSISAGSTPPRPSCKPTRNSAQPKTRRRASAKPPPMRRSPRPATAASKTSPSASPSWKAGTPSAAPSRGTLFARSTRLGDGAPPFLTPTHAHKGLLP